MEPQITVLSPHRDDAAFSLGKTLLTLCRQRLALQVVNIFTISDYGPHAIQTWNSDQEKTIGISGQRRKEDRRVLRLIDRNVCIRELSFEDAPIRLGVDFRSVFRPDLVSVREADVRLLMPVLRPYCSARLVLCPLGLGNHVDHLTTRAAALIIANLSRLAFYQDLPYATWTPEGDIRSIVREVERLSGVALRDRAFKQMPAAWVKRRMAGFYRSQITRSEADAMSRFGEKIWVPAHSPDWSALFD